MFHLRTAHLMRNVLHMETHKYSEQVAAEIRAELGRQKRTMSEVAEASRIPVSTMSRKLNAVGVFDVEELCRIARTLGKPLTHFLPAVELQGEAAA